MIVDEIHSANVMFHDNLNTHCLKLSRFTFQIWPNNKWCQSHVEVPGIAKHHKIEGMNCKEDPLSILKLYDSLLKVLFLYNITSLKLWF